MLVLAAGASVPLLTESVSHAADLVALQFKFVRPVLLTVYVALAGLNGPPVPERRAGAMIFKGVARVEEHNGPILHSQKLSIPAPSVIRLSEYIPLSFERRSLSRKNIL